MSHPRLFLEPAPLWATGGVSAAPVVVRYSSDRFMDDLTADLANNALAARVVGADTRLFQSGHGHYALVLASLVCDVLGRPDHRVSRREAVGFVLRRSMTAGGEAAWVPGGDNGSWVAASQHALSPGEERLGLFPLPWTSPKGQKRTVLAGLLPVARREKYEQAPIPSSASPLGASLAERVDLVFIQVIRSLTRILSADARAEASAQALYDLGAALEAEIGPDWPKRTAGLLDGLRVDTALGTTSLKLAILDVRSRASTHAKLDDLGIDLKRLAADPDLETLAADLQRKSPEKAPPIAGLPTSNGYFARLVFSEPPCAHRPARDTLSPPTVRVRFAGFLDADAPQRPVRIELPDLTSLAAVQHNVGFVTSASMDAAMRKAGDPSILDGDTVDASEDGGWITLYALPIITICATALMMIIATLLNLVFFWLPFLKIRIRRPS